MESNVVSQFDGMEMLLDINKLLDEKAHSQGLSFTTMDPDLRVKGGLSTGIYSFDLITGGGFAPGRFSYLYGETGSCKSTTLFHGIKSALDKSIITSIHDHESSLDPTYLKNIGINFDEICGVRNRQGKWEKTPKMRYSVGTTAEATFKFMNLMLKELPDKVQMWVPKAEEYRYFIISSGYDIKSLTWLNINKGLKAKVEDKPAVLEVADFSPQMVFVVDSLKAMLPDAKDEDFDSEPIALQARCFSQSFPLVKSLIGRKNCIFLATNHITVNPMVKFGSPESEPGGKAVQFYPDLKLKMHINRAQNKLIEEAHVCGEGKDRYLLGKATVLKNKSGPCFRSIDFRLWIDSNEVTGKGIDPVYDIFTFLDSTGLLERPTKSTYGIKLKGWETESFTWKKFKELVLVREEGNKLRKEIEAMLADGSAQERYFQTLANISIGEKAAAAIEDDEVEQIEI